MSAPSSEGQVGSLWSTVLNVASTIGRVAGALAGPAPSVVSLGPVGEGGDPVLGQVVFFRDQGQILAFNTSHEADVGLFFPGNGTNAGAAQQIYLPKAFKAFPIGETFAWFAQHDVDEFWMQRLSAMPSVALDGVGAGSEFHISAQANQPIRPNERTPLGPNFEVRVNVPERTILVAVTGTLTLAAITLLNARAGNTVVRIINALRGTKSTDGSEREITVSLPEGIDVSNGLSSLSLQATVGNLAPAIDDFVREHADTFVELTDEHRALIAEAAAATR